MLEFSVVVSCNEASVVVFVIDWLPNTATSPVPCGSSVMFALDPGDWIVSVNTPAVNVFCPVIVWLLLVNTDNEVDAPAGLRSSCTLKPLTVVEPPLVLAADNDTVEPLNDAVNVNWSDPLVDTCGAVATYASVPSVTTNTSLIDAADSVLLFPTMT